MASAIGQITQGFNSNGPPGLQVLATKNKRMLFIAPWVSELRHFSSEW